MNNAKKVLFAENNIKGVVRFSLGGHCPFAQYHEPPLFQAYMENQGLCLYEKFE